MDQMDTLVLCSSGAGSPLALTFLCRALSLCVPLWGYVMSPALFDSPVPLLTSVLYP